MEAVNALGSQLNTLYCTSEIGLICKRVEMTSEQETNSALFDEIMCYHALEDSLNYLIY